MSLDFEGLKRFLQGAAIEIIPIMLPGGKIRGNEYVCSNLRGGPGDSFSFNLETCLWADFATGEKGGDIIDLYATIENISQGEAAKQLATKYNYRLTRSAEKRKEPPLPVVKINKLACTISRPHPNTNPPNFTFYNLQPIATWCYRNQEGNQIFHVARYDNNGKKEIRPWSYCKTHKKWESKGFPIPRPLYGLEELIKYPNRAVLLVEGEKATEAARKLVDGKYIVLTWPNGSQAYQKADWAPLYNKNILIWPDADPPGEEAGRAIAEMLTPHCKEVKLIEYRDEDEQCNGWDAWDAFHKDKWRWDKFYGFASCRLKVYKEKEEIAEEDEVKDDKLVAVEDEIESSEEELQTATEMGLAQTKGGNIICNVDNVLRAITTQYKKITFVWFDEFYGRTFTNGPNGPREWTDRDDIKLLVYMQRTLNMFKLRVDAIRQAVDLYAGERIRNAPKEWVKSLEYKGTNHLDGWLSACLGVDLNEYTIAAGKNWFIGMVARIMIHGCQMDNMLILQGTQGIGKTNAMKILGGKWHVECNEPITSKDFKLIMPGNLIIEFSELESWRKAEMTAIKQAITCADDRYRAPYERRSTDHPRHCVFVGTTNKDLILRDETGARRFWPITTGKINLKLLAEIRDDLFAEAYHRYKAGETWHEMPEEITRKEQEMRRQVDTWEDEINDWIKGQTDDGVRVGKIWTDCLQGEINRLDKSTQVRIAACLSNLGYVRRTGHLNGKNCKHWIKRTDVAQLFG